MIDRQMTALADRYRIARELGAGGMVAGFDAAGPHANYDVSPDGSWFVFARRGGTNHIVVLQNVQELARRIARGAGTPP